jgi:hypothetical protein
VPQFPKKKKKSKVKSQIIYHPHITFIIWINILPNSSNDDTSFEHQLKKKPLIRLDIMQISNQLDYYY